MVSGEPSWMVILECLSYVVLFISTKCLCAECPLTWSSASPKVTGMLSMHTRLTSEKKFTYTVFSFSEKFCTRVIGRREPAAVASAWEGCPAYVHTICCPSLSRHVIASPCTITGSVTAVQHITTYQWLHICDLSLICHCVLRMWNAL